MSAPSIRSTTTGLAGLVAIALLAAACSSAATTPPPTTAPIASLPAASAPAAGSSAATSAAATGVVVNMATSTLGPVLTGPNGLTLYTHAGDSATASTCTGGCATAWPPLAAASGGATGGTGVSGTFATLTRADGTIQVTYNGLPLYGWKNDTKPGDVTGQGVAGFTVAKP